MSVSSEISRIIGNIAAAYAEISAKGGTLPSAQNSANLAAAIDSIQTGSILMKMGTDVSILNNGRSLRINHNLGVNPNIVVVGTSSVATTTTNRAMYVAGLGFIIRGSTTASSAEFAINTSNVVIPSASGINPWNQFDSFVWMVGYLE